MNKEDRQQTAELYTSGIPCTEIAKRIGSSVSYVYAQLDKAGIKRDRSKSSKYAEISTENIKDMYLSGMSLSEIERETGMKSGSVYYRLKANNVEIRSTSVANKASWLKYDRRRHSCDDGFFDEINTEEKAYWLGFILADGCIRCSSPNTLTINLKKSDIGHLHKFKKNLSATHLVSLHKQGSHPEKISSISITSRQLTSSLKEKGIVANKKRPYQVPDELKRHYWRGAVDGDGSIVKSKIARMDGSIRSYLAVCLAGTEETVFQFSRFCNDITGNKVTASKSKSNMWSVSVHGTSACLVAETLYGCSSVFLDRKKKRLLEILKSVQLP